MTIKIENKSDFLKEITTYYTDKIDHDTQLLKSLNISFNNELYKNIEYIAKSIVTEYEKSIVVYNKIYRYLSSNINFFFDFIENSEVLNYLILKDDLEQPISLKIIDMAKYSSIAISFYALNFQEEIITRIDIRIESIMEDLLPIKEQDFSKYIAFEISEFDDGNTYEYTFFRNTINTNEHVKQFKKLQNYIFQSNSFIYSMREINDHHIFERIYFLNHSTFSKISDFKNLLYTSEKMKPSFEWDFVDTLINIIKITSKVEDFNKDDIKNFLSVIRILNRLLKKTGHKQHYSSFSSEKITSQYHLYKDRKKEIDICFDIDLNSNIKDLVSLKLYKDHYSKGRIETDFTLNDYFYHTDEVIKNVEMLGY